jgi:dolichyl-phosphate beta-glucosyltransferase
MSRLTSIILPTLSEDVSLPLAELDDCLGGLDGEFEVLILDDSAEAHRASERARVAAAQTSANVHARLIDAPRAGKGAAVRLGILEARGDIVFTVDADLPVSLEHVTEFIRLIDGGADVVMAERPLDRRFETWQRYVLSRGLLVMQRALVFHSSEFADTQCGFKAYRGDLVRDIARHQVVDGGMYDLEYLFDARRRGVKIVKITIGSRPESRPSRIDLWKCFRRDWVDVLRIRSKPPPSG